MYPGPGPSHGSESAFYRHLGSLACYGKRKTGHARLVSINNNKLARPVSVTKALLAVTQCFYWVVSNPRNGATRSGVTA